jgi:hypothetical protein
MLAGGDYDAVLAATDPMLAAHPAGIAVLKLRLQAQQATGRPGAALRTVRAIRRLDDSRTMADLERRLAGAVLLDHTSWVPELPAHPSVVDAAGPTIVFAPLFDDRAPGLGAWVDAVLAGLNDAGLRPVVMSSPGATAVGRSSPSGTVTRPGRGGVPWYRLDLGPAYPTDAPADRAVHDHAWAAAFAARSIRPARLVALVAHASQHELTVGLALRAALACPLAAVVAPGTLAPAVEGPVPARLRAADLVITFDDTIRGNTVERLRGLGELAGPLPSPAGAD